MFGILAGLAGELLGAAMQSEDQKQIALQQSRDQRNAKIAETLITGAVAAYGIYSQVQQAKQQAKQNNMVQVSAPAPYSGEINVTPDVPMLESSQPIYDINYSSAWMNRSTNEMGADVVERNSGEVIHLCYRMQGIGNKVYNVYESVNKGEWQQVGTIDWNRMTMADLGSDDTGGPFFAEIARTVMRKR